MSIPVADRPSSSVRAVRELDQIVLDEDVASETGRVPRGARGTVVLVWRDGEAFEVEFTSPFAALVMVGPNQIRLAGDQPAR